MTKSAVICIALVLVNVVLIAVVQTPFSVAVNGLSAIFCSFNAGRCWESS